MLKKFKIFLLLFSFFINISYGNEITIKADSFKNGDFIPVKYSCEGLNISPQISWFNIPSSTKSYILIMEDPDAPIGLFTHWIVYDIPKDINILEEGFKRKPLYQNGIKQGINDFGRIGYDGPCPPKGETHRYFIRIIALDIKTLNLAPKIDRKKLDEALKRYKDHIVGEGYIYGVFKR